jgi:metal-responsive CopG/Arc/MetJ family transcriptional regulator
MGRPKLKQEDKKGKLGISLSKELIKQLDLITNNKSNLIEQIIIEYFKIIKYEK